MFGLYARLAAAAVLAIALAGLVYKVRHSGMLAERAVWVTREAERTAQALVTSESYRLRERAAQKGAADVDKQLQAAKALRAAADGRSADSLRKLNEALARSSAPASDTATASGTDDPRATIIGECAAKYRQVDADARRMAATIAGLQGYAAKVCVTP